MSALRVIALSPLSGATQTVMAIASASSYRLIIGLTQARTASTSNGSPIPYHRYIITLNVSFNIALRGPTAHEIGRAVDTGIRCAGSVNDPGVDSSPGMHEVDRTEPSQRRSGSCCRWPTTTGNKMGG